MLRKRIKAASKFFLDPMLSPANLRSGNQVVYSFVKWGKAILSAAEHPDVVKAGRGIDNAV